MNLDGIHHITAITGDAPGNVDFYARVMGLRLIKKTVNYDAPEVYHLYYGDETGSPGSVLTFFEFPGAPPGRDGAGMVHRITWRVRDAGALDFWARRLADSGVTTDRSDGMLRFADPEGLGLELAVRDVPDAPLAAQNAEIAPEHALLGFDGVRAYAADPSASTTLLQGALGFLPDDDGHFVQGPNRRGSYAYDPPPAEPGRQSAGSVHHVAWAAQDDDALTEWRGRVTETGARPTAVIDRTYFHSIYFHEPSAVLFELATLAPGFAVDEPVEQLGERLQLPERLEPMREQLEHTLAPLPNPRG